MTFAVDHSKMFTQAELARRWRVSPRTLERWRSEGYGPAWLTIGGSIRYRLADVLVFERARRRGT
jgi:DNA-binding XRE family transcriptional regulator